ncbi:hypothetical protein SRHO_G00315810 [Serrasalmus rhombeus]
MRSFISVCFKGFRNKREGGGRAHEGSVSTHNPFLAPSCSVLTKSLSETVEEEEGGGGGEGGGARCSSCTEIRLSYRRRKPTPDRQHARRTRRRGRSAAARFGVSARVAGAPDTGAIMVSGAAEKRQGTESVGAARRAP